MTFTRTSVLFYLAWGGFLWKVSDGKENPVEMEGYLWDHQVKKTFCSLMEKERVYRMENLEIYCAAKVKFFRNQVKKLPIAVLACLSLVNLLLMIGFSTARL